MDILEDRHPYFSLSIHRHTFLPFIIIKKNQATITQKCPEGSLVFINKETTSSYLMALWQPAVLIIFNYNLYIYLLNYIKYYFMNKFTIFNNNI